MRFSESILFALAFGNVGFHIFLASRIEGGGAVNLLQAQCRIVRPNGLRGFPALRFPHNMG